MISQEQLARKVEDHKRWLDGEGGKRLKLSSEDLVGLDLRGMDFTKSIWFDVSVVEVDLRGAILDDINMTRVVFSECDFRGASFKKTMFKFSNFLSCDLSGSNLFKTSFTGCGFLDTTFKGSSLAFTDFYRSSLEQVDLSDVMVKGVGHLGLFSWNGIGEDGKSLVYLYEQDKIWYDEFEGSFDEFEKLLDSKRSGISVKEANTLKFVGKMLPHLFEESRQLYS